MRGNSVAIAFAIAALVAGVTSILVSIFVRGSHNVAKKSSSPKRTASTSTPAPPAPSALVKAVNRRKFALAAPTSGAPVGTLGTTASQSGDPYSLGFQSLSMKLSATGFTWDTHVGIAPSKALLHRLSTLGDNGGSSGLAPVSIGRLFANVAGTGDVRVLAGVLAKGKASISGSKVKLGTSMAPSDDGTIASNTTILLSYKDPSSGSFFTNTVFVFMVEPSGDSGCFLQKDPSSPESALIWGPQVASTSRMADIPPGSLKLSLA